MPFVHKGCPLLVASDSAFHEGLLGGAVQLQEELFGALGELRLVGPVAKPRLLSYRRVLGLENILEDPCEGPVDFLQYRRVPPPVRRGQGRDASSSLLRVALLLGAAPQQKAEHPDVVAEGRHGHEVPQAVLPLLRHQPYAAYGQVEYGGEPKLEEGGEGVPEILGQEDDSLAGLACDLRTKVLNLTADWKLLDPA